MQEITFGSFHGNLLGRRCSPYRQVTPGDWEVFCLQYLDRLLGTYTFQEVTLRRFGWSEKAWVVKVCRPLIGSPTALLAEVAAAYRRIFENALVVY
jgi:hypothetical protein